MHSDARKSGARVMRNESPPHNPTLKRDCAKARSSLLRNSAKANWTMEELGWSVHRPGDMDQWDGMLSWFLKYKEKDRKNIKGRYLDRWYRAARSLNSRDCL
jgi:hypothetical protein